MKALSLFLLLALSVVTIIPTVFADEDEWDGEGEYKREAGEMAREQEREHDDDDGLALGGEVFDAILYGTIAVIVGSIGYTGYKIYKTKRPKLSASR